MIYTDSEFCEKLSEIVVRASRVTRDAKAHLHGLPLYAEEEMRRVVESFNELVQYAETSCLD